MNSGRYASPVVLRSEAPGRWSGEVATLQDEFTFYLSMRNRPDGSLDAVLRNPDRDQGTQWGARRLVRDGEAVRLMARRGDAPERVLASGRYDEESRSFTLAFRAGAGPTTSPATATTATIIRAGAIPAATPTSRRPPRDDGWPTGTLAQAGIDRAAIERLVQSILETPMESPDAPQIHALLIARNGRLVVEEYFHGNSRDTLHDTRSAAKSLTAVAIGAAMRAGAPLQLSSPVYRVMNGGAFPADIEPAKRAMTLEHLLTMSSGWFCDDTNDAGAGQ